jgi:hypothetical protein
MPKTIRLILALALAAVIVVAGGCGSSGQPAQTSSGPTQTAAATQAAEPGDASSASAGTTQREQVHAYAARMMADIKAAEDRGDVIDGTPVGQSDNPYDYVVKMVDLGKPALPAIAAEIESSSADGLREYLLAAAGAQISGETPGDGQSWSTGKEWARQYRQDD